MNIKNREINYWAIPSVRRSKLNPRQREAVANEIIAKVCTYYNITNEEIRGKKLEQDHNSLTKKSNTATTYSNNSNSNNFGQNSQTNMSASNLQSNTQSM